MRILVISLTLLLPSFGRAQNYSDCISAMEICFPQSLTMSASGDGGLTQENIGPPCVHESLQILEFGSNWFKFSFNSSGIFYFTITPSETLSDYDFAVLQAPNDNCVEYLPVRCMASGESIGGPIDSICLGPTGLSPNSTDYYEVAGCGSTHDNFLAPLNVEAGDTYYLMVVDFFQSSTSTDYNIDFYSTAELNCSTGIQNQDVDSQLTLHLMPNPVTDQTELFISSYIFKEISIQVIDMHGRRCLENNYGPNEPIKINTIDLSPGIYNVLLFDKDHLIGTTSFARQ